MDLRKFSLGAVAWMVAASLLARCTAQVHLLRGDRGHEALRDDHAVFGDHHDASLSTAHELISDLGRPSGGGRQLSEGPQ